MTVLVQAVCPGAGGINLNTGEEWEGAARSRFNRQTDLLALAVGFIDSQTLEEELEPSATK